MVVSVIKIDIDYVKSIHSSIKPTQHRIATIKNEGSILSASIDPKILRRNNIDMRLRRAVQNLEQIEHRLRDLDRMIEGVTDKYSLAEQHLVRLASAIRNDLTSHTPNYFELLNSFEKFIGANEKLLLKIKDILNRFTFEEMRKRREKYSQVLPYDHPLGETYSPTRHQNKREDEGPGFKKTLASILLDVIPGVGNLKSAKELYTGKDMVTGEDTSRVMAFIGMIPGVGNAAKGIKAGAKTVDAVGDLKKLDKVQDAAKVTGNAPVPSKPGGGSNPNDFVNPHSEKHLYDPSRPSTPNRTQYGENVDVGKLRQETMTNPDTAYSNWPNPNNPNTQRISKYYKEFDGNISTPDTPTGSHRVFENLDNPTRSSHFPYVPRK